MIHLALLIIAICVVIAAVAALWVPLLILVVIGLAIIWHPFGLLLLFIIAFDSELTELFKRKPRA